MKKTKRRINSLIDKVKENILSHSISYIIGVLTFLFGIVMTTVFFHYKFGIGYNDLVFKYNFYDQLLNEKPAGFDIRDVKEMDFYGNSVISEVAILTPKYDNTGFHETTEPPQIWIYEKDGFKYKHVSTLSPTFHFRSEFGTTFYLDYLSSSPFIVSSLSGRQALLTRWTVTGTADFWGVYPFLIEKEEGHYIFASAFPKELTADGKLGDKIYDVNNSNNVTVSAGIEDYFMKGDSFFAIFRNTDNCKACANKSTVEAYRSTESGMVYDDRIKNQVVLDENQDPKKYINSLPTTQFKTWSQEMKEIINKAKEYNPQ